MAAMAYPKRLLSGGETVVREFRPHWRMLFVPFGWTVLLAAAVILTWIFPPEQKWFDWGITAIAGVAWLILGLYPFISWWFTTYVLTNERLITRRGILARHGLEIPLEQITNVLFAQNILERVLRSGDLLIESAGTSGQSRFCGHPGAGGVPEPPLHGARGARQGAPGKEGAARGMTPSPSWSACRACGPRGCSATSSSRSRSARSWADDPSSRRRRPRRPPLTPGRP